MKMTASSLFVALPLLLVSTAFAQHQIFNVDPQSSEVAFTLGDVLHTVHGFFHVQSGSVNFELSAPNISGSVVIAAGSGKSGNDTRDRKMSSDILDAPHFADASFVPYNYQGTIAAKGDSTIEVTGIFTLHGSPHLMSIPMQLHVEGHRCTAKAHFIVPYVQWGMKDPSTFVLRVAKEVSIDIILVGQISPDSSVAEMR